MALEIRQFIQGGFFKTTRNPLQALHLREQKLKSPSNTYSKALVGTIFV